MSTKQLLMGCGSKRIKEIQGPSGPDWTNLVTLDINEDHDPDIVWDLNILPYPFKSDDFDEIHCYEVMEHLGQQGDYRFFFGQWEEIWRILKPDGQFYGTSPIWSRQWAWGDPGHTRVMQPEQLVFLSQAQYTEQIGKTPMTDYRFCYKADFEPIHIGPMQPADGSPAMRFAYVLQAIKPARIT